MVSTLTPDPPKGMDLDALIKQPERFFNRELGWLAFNRRVMDEAQNPHHPLLERVRFLSIAASNMDEFFMVRVAGLRNRVEQRVTTRSTDGLLPLAHYRLVLKRANKLWEDLQSSWVALQDTLSAEGMRVVPMEDLESMERNWVTQHFEHRLQPALSLQKIQPSHPFPFVGNRTMAFFIQAQPRAEIDPELPSDAFILALPPVLERFIRLPGTGRRFVMLEEVIRHHIDRLLPPPWVIHGMGLFRVIRSGEIEIEADTAHEEDEDAFLEVFQSALVQRHRNEIVAMKLESRFPEPMRKVLQHHLMCKDNEIFYAAGMLGLADLRMVIDKDRSDLLFPPFAPRSPERVDDFGGDVIAAIRHKDFVVHHPYESFDIVIRFIEQAAADPDVIAIKQTIYRTSDQSPIIDALCRAAQAGKSVTALVEIKARFDEEANLRWADHLSRAGVQVLYGSPTIKTHAKISLVVRKEPGGTRSYAHFGTGNYHPHTARLYTDLSFFTSDPDLCQDADRVFRFLENDVQPHFARLLVSPQAMRSSLLALIDNERQNVENGHGGGIWMKCNSLLDPLIIDALYRASQAGVPIDLIVRGACMLRPGIAGLSKTIRVKSLVGRFLEHARIYAFGGGAALPSRQAHVYIGSADMMPRNLDRRIEVLVPIDNPTVHAQILDQILVANLKDRRQSWQMQASGHYVRTLGGPDDFCAHSFFMRNPSLSGRGQALLRKAAPQQLILDDQT